MGHLGSGLVDIGVCVRISKHSLHRCDEACEDGGAVGEERTEIEESDPIEDVGEKGRRGGGVEGMDFKVGSKGELDGELGKRVSLIGKVNARGVGEMMDTVGGSGASVETSRAARGRTRGGGGGGCGKRAICVGCGGGEGSRAGARGECAAWDRGTEGGRRDLLRAEASRVR